MTELKQLDIAHQFCKLIQKECTGSREQLAKQFGITPTWVSKYKRKLEYLYQVEIKYCRKRQSYYLPNNDSHKLPPPNLDLV